MKPPLLRAWPPILALGALVGGCIDSNRVATCPLPPGEAPPKVCTAGTKPADDGLIADFEDGATKTARVADRGGDWFTSADPNGSSIDPKPLVVSSGGADGSQKAIHVFGQTSNASGAWGVLLGANIVNDGVYDASKYAGISFKAKAGKDASKTVLFKVADVNTHQNGGVCKNCWNHFEKEIVLTPDWKEYDVPFADLRQEPGWGDQFPSITTSKIMALNWAYGPSKAFDLWIDDVQFYECK